MASIDRAMAATQRDMEGGPLYLLVDLNLPRHRAQARSTACTKQDVTLLLLLHGGPVK